jgi:RHS repeat-associated protein
MRSLCLAKQRPYAPRRFVPTVHSTWLPILLWCAMCALSLPARAQTYDINSATIDPNDNVYLYGPWATFEEAGQAFADQFGATVLACSPSGAPTSGPPLEGFCSWITTGYTVQCSGLSAQTSTDCIRVYVGGNGPAQEYFVQAYPTTASSADSGCSRPACNNGPDPVNPFTGNEFLTETDITVGAPQPLNFSRYYNSLDTTAADQGPGWSHSFSRHVSVTSVTLTSSYTSSPYITQAEACTSGWDQIRANVAGFETASASFSNGVCTVSAASATMSLPILSTSTPGGSVTEVQAYRDDGHIINFTSTGSTFTPEPGIGYQLVNIAGGGYQLIDEQDNVETYDSSGKLLTVSDRAGNTQTLTYRSSVGLLSSVSDSFGHALTFAYDSENRLASVTAPNGSAVQYAYSGSGDLSQVTNLDGTTRQYTYRDPNWASGVSSVVDESGQTEFTLSYNSQGQVLSSTLGGVSSSMSFSYTNGGSTSETDPLGANRTFQFEQIGDHELSSAVTGAPCFKCGYVASTTYDSGGYLASETDFNGNATAYVYDDTRGLETSRTEASGATVASTITTQWSSSYRLPTLISEYAGGTASGTPIRTTSFTYDSSGNLLSKAVTDPATGSTRTFGYTYDSNGRALTATDPRGNVTTYAYYTCTTGSQCGQLETASDALGHVTTYNTYNADGHPLTITDPNGVLTILTYDARDRLTSRTFGAETTSFSYYPTGLLEQVTLPDGSSLSYTYDAAHRLTQVSDGLGNKVVYTLDAIGNHIAENTYDLAGTLHRTHTRVINALNEVYQDVNAAGTSAVTTTFAYDNNGNRTSIDAPLSRNSEESYDALNRISSTTDAGNGIANYQYDAEDDITSVKDPRSLTTTYSYDGFGDLTSLVSPDTGNTSYAYDLTGNLATSTDARGAVSTYSYDALNRVTSIAYSLNGTTDQTLSFTYDQGSNGIGHLTGASDANHSISFSYDALGEMTSMSQTVGGVARTISYAYTNGDLTTMTTPSGQVITYGYNANHQITSIAANGTTILSNVGYEPFGPPDAWTWGNGTTFKRSFDGDGTITNVTSPGAQESLIYDDASRITSIGNSVPGASSWTYGYDQLDRLTSATSSSISQGWTYDANGNRLSETGNFYPSTYSVSPTSNQMSTITGTLAGTASYDAAGHLITTGSNILGYNDRGRESSVVFPGGFTESLTYDAFNRLISVDGGVLSESGVYDRDSHVLGEYDPSGNLLEETVWLGDVPVATLQPNGSGGIDIYYIHTDHLNTPRAITRPSDNAMVWQWDSDPFGYTAPNEDPSGLGTFIYNLRFPGQIVATNGARTYDAIYGSYDQSDPIGLQGGSFSTYSYVGDNPLSNFDPDGLQVVPGAEIGTLVDPGLGTVIGGVIGAGVEAGAAVYESCRDHNCPPCTPYGAGTIGYQGPHTTHEHFSKVLGRYLNPHLHLYIVRQNTKTCQCFWNDAKPDAVEPPPEPDWVNLNGGFPPLSP